ncbi:MAG TPA: ParB N-terminal domain-containing protein [bacterium]|nr:ParB N-terminal domain-containing protein [bacterium]
MKGAEFNQDTMTLRGKEIEVTVGFLLQVELKFYPENPRIYSIISADDRQATQDQIEEALKAMDHVRQLAQSIKANGGLTDPLLVRKGDLVVLEGNSRLAAYRMLFVQDPLRWGKVKCKLLPHNIAEKDVFALLGEYHIIGKKDWAPYEQAGYLYRRHKRHGVSPTTMGRELGLSGKKVEQLIAVYAFMVDHEENDVKRWSYYEEYLKCRAIGRAREAYPRIDQVVVKKIKNREIPRAVDIRDKLKAIVKSNRALRDFIHEKKDFEQAYESAQTRGVGNVCYGKLLRFRTWLADAERVEDMDEMEEQIQAKCKFELRKIEKRCNGLLKGLDQ